MGRANYDTTGVAVAFGLLGALLSGIWALGIASGQSSPSVSLLALGVGVTTVVTALVSLPVWRLIVRRFDRWAVPTRGAIAGALTVWASLSVSVPVIGFLDRAI